MDDINESSKMISRRGFLRATRNVIVGGAIAGFGLWPYLRFERGWFDVIRETLFLDGLPKNFDGICLVHLSDLHFNEFITPDRFTEVVDLVLAEKPDLIAITGDFIDRRTNLALLPEYLAVLRKLFSSLETVAVLGNHDHWVDAPLVRNFLSKAGIKDISNQNVSYKRGSETLYLCGLDSHMEGLEDISSALEGVPKSEKAILLVHEPDYADFSAAMGRFSLQLSGHSHGGQIYVPLFGPPVTPDYGRKYPRGLYSISGMNLYTNTGIGMIPPFVRFNCRPEIAVLTLGTNSEKGSSQL